MGTKLASAKDLITEDSKAEQAKRNFQLAVGAMKPTPEPVAVQAPAKQKKYDKVLLGIVNTLKPIYTTDKTTFETLLVQFALAHKLTTEQVASVRTRLETGIVGAKQGDIREFNKEQIAEIERKVKFATELWNIADSITDNYELRAFLYVCSHDVLNEVKTLRPSSTENRSQQQSPGYTIMLTTANCVGVSETSTESVWESVTWGLLHYGWMVNRDSYLVRPIPVQTRIGAHKVVASVGALNQIKQLCGVQDKPKTKPKSKSKKS